MRAIRYFFLLGLLAPLLALGANEADLDQFNLNNLRAQKVAPKGPQLDPKRIINQSNSFLKEREPEMTEEEYALYEKIVTILADAGTRYQSKLYNPAFLREKNLPAPAGLTA